MAPHTIEYLSPPAEVGMANQWFEIAPPDHFWVRRRFEVLQRLAGGLISRDKEMADVGCGHGLLQLQVEEAYGGEVTGFDLNEVALKQNLSRRSRICSYDILERNPSLQGRFDLIFLFDVLEHIADEDRFLQAVLFHLKPGGNIIVNVPAGQWAFSAYDTVQGHVRRYSMKTLRETAARSGLEAQTCTYWGLPLVPTILVRKLLLAGKRDQSQVMAKGFGSRSATMNNLLRGLSLLEWLPQEFLGTSVMAVLHHTTR